MAKKNNRKRKSSGWAKTKSYPHERHPATYRRKGSKNDDIEYITFTHSPEVDFGNKKVRTVPLLDNVSPMERRRNKAQGKKFGENRSYAYPNFIVLALLKNRNRGVRLPLHLLMRGNHIHSLLPSREKSCDSARF